MLRYPLYRIFKNRNKYISNKNFLIIASIIVGVVSGFAAITLKSIINFIESILLNQNFLELQMQLLVYPLIGILLSLIILKYLIKKVPFEKGLTSIIYNVKYKKANVDEEHTYAHLATSAVTVSLGGSVGVEAPIAITGAAIGSNIAKRLFVSPNDKALLLACGAAAGISAIFNSPIAGVIFAFEVILSSVSVSGFIPLLIASATASLINHLFYTGQLISFRAESWYIQNIPYYILLGILCGLVSAYTIKTIYNLENKFNNKFLKFNKAIFQGLIVGILILFSPMLYGEGYYIINQIMDGNIDVYMQKLPLQKFIGYELLFMLFIILTIILKPVASGLTIAAGGNGGIFAPSLFNGALTGLLFTRLILFLVNIQLPEINFVLAGMAGLLSGVVSAPLTGIFMIAEVSGGYNLLLPLMIVSSVSFFVTRFFEPNSIYNKKLAEIGKLNVDMDEIALNNSFVFEILETDAIILNPDQFVKEVINIIRKSSGNIYVVINADKSIAGLITFNDLKPVLFNNQKSLTLKVKDLMQGANIILDYDDKLTVAKKEFENNEDLFYIPVQQNNAYAGLVSRNGFINKYKDLLKEVIAE